MTLADKQVTEAKGKILSKNGAADAAPSNNDSIVNSLSTEAKPLDIFTSSSGLTFKLKKVSAMLISEAGRKIVRPTVPVVFIEEKGREEENPNDPNYLAAQQNANWETTVLTINVTIAFGTQVIEDTIPSDVEHWESLGWSDSLEELLGLKIAPAGRARYSAWVKFYALPDHQELLDLQRAIAIFSGNVPEAAVADAEDAFRNNEEGRSTEGISPEEEV